MATIVRPEYQLCGLCRVKLQSKSNQSDKPSVFRCLPLAIRTLGSRSEGFEADPLVEPVRKEKKGSALVKKRQTLIFLAVVSLASLAAATDSGAVVVQTPEPQWLAAPLVEQSYETAERGNQTASLDAMALSEELEKLRQRLAILEQQAAASELSSPPLAGNQTTPVQPAVKSSGSDKKPASEKDGPVG